MTNYTYSADGKDVERKPTTSTANIDAAVKELQGFLDSEPNGIYWVYVHRVEFIEGTRAETWKRTDMFITKSK